MPLGINTWRWKMLALMVSAGMGSAAGGLYAIVLLVVTPQTMFGALRLGTSPDHGENCSAASAMCSGGLCSALPCSYRWLKR